MSDASVLAGGHRICYNFGMKSSFKIALAFVAAAWAAAADVVSFPGCPWRETKTVARGDAVRVVDAAGRTLLVFNTEGGAFGRHLVVSQAVDHLVVDARAAFKAGMRKLVFTSANFDPKPYRGRDCTLVTELGGARGTEGLAYFEGHTWQQISAKTQITTRTLYKIRNQAVEELAEMYALTAGLQR